MDTQRRPDDLTDLERRLTACAPSADGLDADAMLFAAGRASARRRGRFAWAALTACLAVLSFALGVRLATERGGRTDFAQQPSPPAPVPPPAVVPEQPTVSQPSGDSVLASHQALEHGLDAWPPAVLSGGDAPSPEPPVLRVGLPDSLPDL